MVGLQILTRKLYMSKPLYYLDNQSFLELFFGIKCTNLKSNESWSFKRFEDEPDEMMTEVSNFTKTFLQVKVDSTVRSDTGKPNNSPIVLVKPYYR